MFRRFNGIEALTEEYCQYRKGLKQYIKDLLRKVKKKNKKLVGMKKGAPNQAAEYFKN